MARQRTETMHSRVDIDLGERSYSIHIGAGLLNQGRLLGDVLGSKQVLIVSNDVVAALYLKQIQTALQQAGDRRIETLILPDGEAHKNIIHWQLILDKLIQMRSLRDVALIALGGGVIGDLTGFAAASYMRGVDFIQIPTTLLAQVDAAVGGKTAVNHPRGKNLIGAFHQPRAVFIDTDTLDTLPAREYRAGLAETIKYGLIGDVDFLEWLLQQRVALLDHDPDALREAIERSCRHKAQIVAADEREGGVRALLNLGHTFGHAIEAASGYGVVLHGEAVAIGCCLAANLSARLGLISEQDAGGVCDALKRFGLPTSVPSELDAIALVDLMQLDKKNRDGRIRLVLFEAIGTAAVRDAPEARLLLEVIEASQRSAR